MNRTSCQRHLRNHHTTRKNQKTMTKNTMYHSQRQPCRVAMLFILRNVPERIPPVSAKASFIWLSCIVDSRTSFPMPIVISFSNFTLALNPSRASSFWPSKSSAYRCAFNCCALEGNNGPEDEPRSAERSRSEGAARVRWDI